MSSRIVVVFPPRSVRGAEELAPVDPQIESVYRGEATEAFRQPGELQRCGFGFPSARDGIARALRRAPFAARKTD